MARPREFDEPTVLRAALKTFWRQGYQATSTRDIERSTGLTTGSLYKAYGSKRAVFLACLELYMENESYLAFLLKMNDKPIRQSLRSLLDRIIDSASETGGRPSGCLVTNLVSELLPVDEQLGQTAASGLAQVQQALRFRFQEAREKGELRDGINTDALGAYFMVVIQGMLVLSASTKDVAAMKQVRDMALASLD